MATAERCNFCCHEHREWADAGMCAQNQVEFLRREIEQVLASKNVTFERRAEVVRLRAALKRTE